MHTQIDDMEKALDELKILLDVKDVNSIFIDGIEYEAKPFLIKQVPGLHRLMDEISTGSLEGLNPDDYEQYYPHACTLINASFRGSFNPTETDEEQFSKALALTIKANKGFFIRRLLKHMQMQRKLVGLN